MQVTAALNEEEQGLLSARNGLEGLAGLVLQHDTIACLRSFLTAFHGAPSSQTLHAVMHLPARNNVAARKVTRHIPHALHCIALQTQACVSSKAKEDHRMVIRCTVKQILI